VRGLGAMALGIASTAIETLKDIAGAKTPTRTTQMLRDTPDAQSVCRRPKRRCAPHGCFCSTASISSVHAPSNRRDADGDSGRTQCLVASHAVASAVEAVDLMYIADVEFKNYEPRDIGKRAPLQ
jgi:hypothetical protein